jgi:ATP-dependent protease ClpP protease subunit
MADIDRDRFMTPQEAVDYGIVDAIMAKRPAPARKVA